LVNFQGMSVSLSPSALLLPSTELVVEEVFLCIAFFVVAIH